MATNVSQRRVWKLRESIKRCYDDFIIDLSNGGYIDEDMQMVADHIKQHRKCQQLLVQQNQITEEGASHLATALKRNTCLQKLNIGNNQIGDQGVEYLVEPLFFDNDTLIKLHLQSNSITEKGAEYLAEMLRYNPAILKLGLDYNQIGDKGVDKICSALNLNENTRLKALYLDSNKITDDGACYLAELLQSNQSLIGFTLAINDISDSGVQQLIQTLIDSNPRITGFNIFSNKRITDASLDSFLQLFNQSRRLNLYKLYDCGFSENGKDQLKAVAECKGFDLMLAGDGFDYEYHRRRPIIRKSFNKTRKSHENWFDERRKQQRETNSQPSRNIDSTIPSTNEHHSDDTTIGLENLTIEGNSSSNSNESDDDTNHHSIHK